MPDPKGSVILYLRDERAGPTAPVSSFHSEFFLVFSKITAEGGYRLKL